MFIESLQMLFTVEVLVVVLIGFALGALGGAIPGIGPELVIILLIPFTLGMDPTIAIVFMVVTYSGGQYASSIPAILLNVPGAASAAAVTLDGYPMAKKGRAVEAISASGAASAAGNLVGGTIVLLALPLLSGVVLFFGTPEYFMMAVLGLCAISMVSSGGLFKGLVVTTLGALIGTIGTSSVVVSQRFTFGILELQDGVPLIPLFVGLFALTEMAKLAGTNAPIVDQTAATNVTVRGSRLRGIKATIRAWWLVIKSSVIGLWVGIMPGSGGTIANFMAYGEARRAAKDPDSFGKGNIEGVIAPEASNNAVIPGALVPTFAFGIPGSATTAVLLGAMMLHGFQPGPNMFTGDMQTTYTIFTSIILTAGLLLAVGSGLANYFGKVPNVPPAILVPVIVVVAIAGVFASENNYYHVFQALVFGAIGLVLTRFEFPIIPFVLGFILSPIAELNLSRALLISGGSLDIFVTRPGSAVMLVLSVLILFWPLIKKAKDRRIQRVQSDVAA